MRYDVPNGKIYSDMYPYLYEFLFLMFVMFLITFTFPRCTSNQHLFFLLKIIIFFTYSL